MDWMLVCIYVYVFVIGSVIGSFLNVVIWRVPQDLSFVKGRSYCPHCHTTLKPYDMIPILSWMLLKGKCRFCKEPISIRYPLIELAGGLLAMVCFHHFMFTWDTLLVFTILLTLLAITMIDFATMTIPNGLIIFLIFPIIIVCILHPEMAFLDRAIGFFMISLPMYLLTLLIPDCFGGGDIKLIAVCGFLLGWKMVILAMFLAIFTGGIYACYLVISKKAKKGAHMAFGPYICLGVSIALFYGPEIVNAYLSLFGL